MEHLYVKFGDPCCIDFLRNRLEKQAAMKTYCRRRGLYDDEGLNWQTRVNLYK